MGWRRSELFLRTRLDGANQFEVVGENRPTAHAPNSGGHPPVGPHPFFIRIVPIEPSENSVAGIPVTLGQDKTKNTWEATLNLSITAASFFLATLVSIPALAQTRALGD